MKQLFKTTVLLAVLGALFLSAGYAIGGQGGMLMALTFAVVFNFGTYWFSSSMVLKMQGARPLAELQDTLYPGAREQIERTVRELVQADDLPMPALYYVDTPIPNAFATGRSPRHAVVAVTTGILGILSEAELKAVLGHELGHVKNRDMLVSTVAATIATAVQTLANFAFVFTGSDEDRPNPLALIAISILGPVAAVLIQLAVSRSREFLADQHGAGLDGTGKHLASALQKLEDFKAGTGPIQPTPIEQATAHLMFTNPFSMHGVAGLFSTHPSTEARIERLKQFDTHQTLSGTAGGPILDRR